VIERCTVTSANDVSECDPKGWQFQGSNDSTRWATLDTRSDQSFDYRFQTRRYEVTAPGAYRYYQLNVTANHGADATRLSALGLWEVPGL
jgi:hypothetical protein